MKEQPRDCFVSTASGLVLLCVLALFSCERAPSPDEKSIIFFGDSITRAGTRPSGYISLIRRSLNARGREQQVRLINAGVSGDTVADLERRLERDVIRREPDTVVVYIGINDVWGSTPDRAAHRKKRYEAGLRRIIARIKETGARVILCTQSVIGEKRKGANQFDGLLDEYADTCRAIAKETGIQLCELREAFVAHIKKNNPDNLEAGILTNDGVHLNDAGNRLVAVNILAALRTADVPH